MGPFEPTMPPVLPDCPDPDDTVIVSGTVTEVVPVGCDVCVQQTADANFKLNLNCTPISGEGPFSYFWMVETASGTRNLTDVGPILRVNREGNYTCIVTNEDGMDQATSRVFCM